MRLAKLNDKIIFKMERVLDVVLILKTPESVIEANEIILSGEQSFEFVDDRKSPK